MNDRLRKMAIEADAWCDQRYLGEDSYNIEWETKFAQLIVRECQDFVGDKGSMAVKEMLEHFGVEE